MADYSKIKAEEYAYRDMGSSPCEGCHSWRKCDEMDLSCKEKDEYQKEFDKLVEKYEDKIKENQGNGETPRQR